MSDSDNTTDRRTPTPVEATFIELRAHINRAQRCAEHLATEAPEPQRHGFDGVRTLLENARRILGEIAESATTSRAQADLDQLRRWNARSAAMRAGASYIELDADQSKAFDGGDLMTVGVVREHAERIADDRRELVHIIRSDGTVAEIVQPEAGAS
jgi:hypothetical protein